MPFLLDLNNAADILPPIAAGKIIGYYDFTKPRGMQLVCGSGKNPGMSDPSGRINYADKVYNLLDSAVAGNLPDLIGAQNWSTSIDAMTHFYAGNWKPRAIGSLGGLFFSNIAQGATTPLQTFNVTAGSVVISPTDIWNFTGPTTGTMYQGVYNKVPDPSSQFKLYLAPDGNYYFYNYSQYSLYAVDVRVDGSYPFTLTRVSDSATVTVTGANYVGAPVGSATQLYTIVDVFTTERCLLLNNKGNVSYINVSALGPLALGMPGYINQPTYYGKLVEYHNPDGSMTPLDCTGLYTGGSFDGQTFITVRVMSASDSATWVNGTKMTATAGAIKYGSIPWRLSIGCGRGNQANSPGAHTHHFTAVYSGAATDAEVGNITKHFNAIVMNATGKSTVRKNNYVPVSYGQSNSSNRANLANGATYAPYIIAPDGNSYPNYLNTTGGDYSNYVTDEVWNGLTGCPNNVDCTAGVRTNKVFGIDGTILLASEYNNTSSTAYNTNGNMVIDDITSAVTQGDPSTYTMTTTTMAGADSLAQWKALATQGMGPLRGFTWIQGESSVTNWDNSGNSNAGVTGCTYATALSHYDFAHRYAVGLEWLPKILQKEASLTYTPIVGIQPVVSNDRDDQWAAYQILCDQAAAAVTGDNPPAPTHFLSNACPWHNTGIPGIHYPCWTYEYLAAETARTWAWLYKKQGWLYTEGCDGPTYGQFPRITGVTAVAGNKYVDITVSNPNNASTLKLNGLGILTWGVYSGTTSQAIKTETATTNGLTGSAGTMEIGGTSILDTTGAPTLISPFVIRLPLTSVLTSGTKVTVFYAKPSIMTPLNNGFVYPLPNDPFQNMITDDAGTACPPEPLLNPMFRRDMPLTMETCGFVVTVA